MASLRPSQHATGANQGIRGATQHRTRQRNPGRSSAASVQQASGDKSQHGAVKGTSRTSWGSPTYGTALHAQRKTTTVTAARGKCGPNDSGACSAIRAIGEAVGGLRGGEEGAEAGQRGNHQLAHMRAVATNPDQRYHGHGGRVTLGGSVQGLSQGPRGV